CAVASAKQNINEAKTAKALETLMAQFSPCSRNGGGGFASDVSFTPPILERCHGSVKNVAAFLPWVLCPSTAHKCSVSRNVPVIICGYQEFVSGSSSAVERQLPKLDVAGSIPVSRSKFFVKA